MTNIIEVGDVITGHEGEQATVKEILIGKYGLFVTASPIIKPADFTDILFCTGFYVYLPFELPPTKEVQKPWYSFDRYGSLTLPSGKKVGYVGTEHVYGKTIEQLKEMDSLWERTLETIRLERMSDSNIGQADTMQSRPFTEQSRPDVL